MPVSRLHLLTGLAGVAGVFATNPLLAGLQAPSSGTAPRAKVYPNSRDPRADVAKLYEMASDLKDESIRRTRLPLFL